MSQEDDGVTAAGLIFVEFYMAVMYGEGVQHQPDVNSRMRNHRSNLVAKPEVPARGLVVPPSPR